MTCNTCATETYGVEMLNWVIPQGTDWEQTFQILDGVSGEAIALDGYAFAGHARASQASGAALAFSFTFTVDLDTDEVTVSLSGATTTALTVGSTVDSAASKFWYDFELTTPGGDVERFQEGVIRIKREMTRP